MYMKGGEQCVSLYCLLAVSLHFKHGLFSQDEVDYIKARHKARFKWNDSMKVYEFSITYSSDKYF